MAQARARAIASSCVLPTRTIDRSGSWLPGRLTQAIQWGPRGALWISYGPGVVIVVKTYQIWPDFAMVGHFAPNSFASVRTISLESVVRKQSFADPGVLGGGVQVTLTCPNCGNDRNFQVKTLQMHVVHLEDGRVEVSDESRPAVLEVLCDECESALNFEEFEDPLRKEVLLTIGAR